MLLHLVRHACAGRKGDWDGPDDERPLDPVGLDQAAALDELFATSPPTGLLSSPSRRCVQTVELIARRHGLPIVTADELRAGVPTDELLAYLVDRVDDRAVVCTHGEVMEGLLPRLPPDIGAGRRELLTKGGMWTLTLTPDDPASITGLRHRVPSSMRACASHDGPSGR